MAATIFNTATEYVANEIQIHRGSVVDIILVGVFHTTDPGVIPTEGQFTEVTLVDGVNNPSNTLAQAGKIEVVSLIGPGTFADLVLTPGTYQRFVLVKTTREVIIRRPDTLEVI